MGKGACRGPEQFFYWLGPWPVARVHTCSNYGVHSQRLTGLITHFSHYPTVQRSRHRLCVLLCLGPKLLRLPQVQKLLHAGQGHRPTRSSPSLRAVLPLLRLLYVFDYFVNPSTLITVTTLAGSFRSELTKYIQCYRLSK